MEHPWLTVAGAPEAQNIEPIESGGVERDRVITSATSPLGAAAIYGHSLEPTQGANEAVIRAAQGESTEFLTDLGGSYSMVARQGRNVHIQTDLVGQFPLYYRKDGDGIRVSSDASRLADDTNELDTTSLAARIIAPQTPDLYANRTTYSDVHRVEPGMSFDFDGSHIRSSREIPGGNGTLSLDEAAELLRSAVQRSVGARLAKADVLSCDFSGGYDSTSLAYIAASLREGIYAFTDNNPAFPTEDYAVVQRLLQIPESNSLRWFELNTDAQSVTGELEYDRESDEPNITTLVHGFFDGVHEYAQTMGASMHLCGSGGDEIALPGLEYLADIARTKDVRSLLHAAQAEARIRKAQPWQTIKSAYAQSRSSPEHSLHEIGIALQQSKVLGNQMLISDSMPPLYASWLTRSARQSVSDLALERAETLRGAVGGDYANYAALRGLRVTGNNYQHIIRRSLTRYGVEAHAPFLDDDVIRACLSTAGYNRKNPAIYKQIMQLAFDGIVPREVLTRSSKSSYDGAYFDTMRARMPFLQQLMVDSRLADLGIIEPKEVNTALQRIMRGESVGPSLDTLIAQELWLRGRESPDMSYHPVGATAPQRPEEYSMTITNKEGAESVETGYRFGIFHGIKAVEFTGKRGTAFFNAETGDRFSLSHAQASLLARITEADSLSTVIEDLTEGLDEADTRKMKELVLRNLSMFLSDGLLVKNGGMRYGGVVHGEQMNNRSTEKDRQAVLVRPGWKEATIPDYVAALAGTATALLLTKRFKFNKVSKFLGFLERHWITADATSDQAERSLAAINKIDALYPGKMACQEISASAILALALRRKRLSMVIGAATNPLRFHAWNEAQGEVVIRDSDDNPNSYTPIHKL